MSRLLQRPETPDDWQRLARQLIRMHMTLLGWRFADLARALTKIGVEEDEVLLRNRIGLGRFRATLFIQCLMAMGVDDLRLPLIVRPTSRDADDGESVDQASVEDKAGRDHPGGE